MAVEVFVSYSRQDRERVERLIAALEAQDTQKLLSFWWDQDNVGGAKWWKTILQNIRSSDAFVVCVSDSMASSTPCKLELEYARDCNRHILPVLVSNVTHKTLRKVKLVDTHYDVYTVDEPNAEAIYRSLQRTPIGRKLPVPLPNEPDLPKHPLTAAYDALERNVHLSFAQQRKILTQLQSVQETVKLHEDILQVTGDLLRREEIAVSIQADLKRLCKSLQRTEVKTIEPRDRKKVSNDTGPEPTKAEFQVAVDTIDQVEARPTTESKNAKRTRAIALSAALTDLSEDKLNSLAKTLNIVADDTSILATEIAVALVNRPLDVPRALQELNNSGSAEVSARIKAVVLVK